MFISIKRLKFTNPVIEKEFLNDYSDKSLLSVRIALILGIALYSLFGILDLLIPPSARSKILFIRFAIVCPGLLFVFVISFFTFFKKFMQPILMFITLVAGLGIVAMVGITVETEIGLYYYAGLMLVLMWAYTFIKLRFLNAAIVCWTIILGYEVTTIFFQEMLKDRYLLNIFISNNFFFISSNIIGMFTCYLLEFYTRKDFVQRKEIAESRDELQTERNELKNILTIMNDELEMASRIQKELISTVSSNENLFSLYKPMSAIGGDYMEFIKFENENKTGIFLSDVSGHGVPAALITSMIKIIIQESKNLYHDPSMLLLHLNQVLSTLTDEIFVTAFYCIYDSSDQSIIYSNAGHHPPSVIINENVTTLKESRSLPLSVMNNIDLIESGYVYTNHKEILPAASKLFLYTDGLVEARESNLLKSEFGDELDRRMIRLQNLNCKDFTESIFRELIEFQGSESFEDDICIICLDVI